MRSLFRRGIIFGTALVAGALWAGCDAKQQTEYVTGISTQVTVPRDLKSVLVEVAISGVQQFCRAYRVYDGKVQLPRSLGTFAQNDPTASGPVTYTIIGISEEFSDSSSNPLFDGTCTNLTIGQNNARILRRSRQPYVPEQILFLPMPLKYACVDKNCGDDETCKGGKCVSATVAEPEKTFPRYTPDLADGTGGTCFHANAFKGPDGTTDVPGCMTAALPAITVDAGKCIYAVPNTPSAPLPVGGQASPFTGASSGDGVNVQVTFDGLQKEILDSDPDEGFSVPDPTKPQQFKLADGLCDMVKGTNGAVHQITNIRASGTCQAKRLAQPLCAADQNAAMGLDPSGLIPTPPPAEVCENVPLTPLPSALMLVIDDSANGASFFKALGGAGVDPDDDIIGPAVKAAFKSQSFAQTTFGVFYTTTGATPATCGAENAPADPTVGIGPLTLDGVDAKFASIQSHAPSTTISDANIRPGLASAYKELSSSQYDADVARSVVVFSTQFGAGANCADPSGLADDNASAARPITTYAIQIVKSPIFDPSDPTTPAYRLAAAGKTPPAAYKVLDSGGAGAKFRAIIHDLATCAYEVPKALLKHPVDGTETLSFSDVGTGNELPHPSFNAACTTKDGPGDGWGVVNGATSSQIYLCGAACKSYRDTLDAALVLGTTYAQPAQAVPIHLRGGCP